MLDSGDSGALRQIRKTVLQLNAPFQLSCRLALIQAAFDQEQREVHDSDHFLHAIRDLLKLYSSEGYLYQNDIISSATTFLLAFSCTKNPHSFSWSLRW